MQLLSYLRQELHFAKAEINLKAESAGEILQIFSQSGQDAADMN